MISTSMDNFYFFKSSQNMQLSTKQQLNTVLLGTDARRLRLRVLPSALPIYSYL